MSYKLEFLPSALKEWRKLDSVIADQFRRKLLKLRDNPRVSSLALRNLKDCYKVKLASAGFRLVYQVVDDRMIVQVVAVGKRSNGDVYDTASKRV
ncbi:type II toxin-antitoxin system RelE family toxin [Ketogulonicigenium vulgare]|uniref:type II toxin-antitoxin system RelE family toxin n=1 Tax=Ketogulonicigenium vulgare TaxID=92945 RepID=UPI002358508D|nr:type II toxin-antitoxin system RelE/ParE family toxin [Ketogulonicigenium vulgare]